MTEKMSKLFRTLCLALAIILSAVSLAACSFFEIPDNGDEGDDEIEIIVNNVSPVTVAVGQSVELNVMTTGDMSLLEFYSSDPGICEVDETEGVITGVSIGETYIIIILGNVTKTVDVAVTAPGANTEYDITVSPTTGGTITPSKTKAKRGERITVTATPNNGYSLTSLTYNGSDIFTAKAFTMPADSVVIAGTFSQVPPITITVKPTAVTLLVGQSQTMTATTSDTSAVTWSVENTAIASANSSGVIKALAKGTTNIVATARDGNTKKVPLTVTDSLVDAASGSVTKAGYTLTFSDEFNGSALNTSKWGYQYGTKDHYGTAQGADFWGNDELQYYTDNSENVSVSGGSLHIVAKQTPQPEGRNYSSGRILTRDKFSQTFGYFEARIKTTVGEGIWPAFWMLPQPSAPNTLENEYGGWAASGEIDIMEAKGRLQNVVDMTIHCGGPWPNNYHRGDSYEMSTNIDQWHVYAIDWTSERISWYVDGVQRFSQTNVMWSSTASEAPSAPFDKPFYVLLNLAMGGMYDEHRIPTVATATMDVDYVRVWQKNA